MATVPVGHGWRGRGGELSTRLREISQCLEEALALVSSGILTNRNLLIHLEAMLAGVQKLL